MNFLELTKLRHSVRSYQSRKVEQDKLEYIMECVRLAPSAVNFQPWYFYVIDQPEQLAAIRRAYNREWIESAPCIIVACTDHNTAWHRKIDGKDHADIDIAIAVEHLCLAAAEQGLGTCWVCNFDPSVCREVLSLEDHIEPAVMIPLGYAQDAAPVEKKRKAMDEIICR